MTGMQKLLGVELTDKLMTGTSFTMQEGMLILAAMNARKFNTKEVDKKNKDIYALTNPKIQNILDVRPNLAKIAASLVMRGKDVYGVDFNQERLEKALIKIKLYAGTRFHEKKIDPRQIEGLKERIDAAYCASGFSYLGDSPTLIFEGVYKTLVQGGVFAITGYNGAYANQTGNRMMEEIKNAMIIDKQGKSFIPLSQEERETITEAKLKLAQVMPPEEDSPSTVKEALETVGFKIINKRTFYPISVNNKQEHGGYFILAKKG